MSWTWLFVWNVSWLVFALVYLSLETKLKEGLPQCGQGGKKLERREVVPPSNRPVRAPRVHRHGRGPRDAARR
jgi:hypothetical protein